MYTPPVYNARNLIAALDYNSNCDRDIPRKKDGSQRRCICAEKREIVEEITKIEGRLRTLLPQIENIPCSMDAVMNKRAASTPITTPNKRPCGLGLPPNAPRRLINEEEVITISDESTSLEEFNLSQRKEMDSAFMADTVVDSPPVEDKSPAAER